METRRRSDFSSRMNLELRSRNWARWEEVKLMSCGITCKNFILLRVHGTNLIRRVWVSQSTDNKGILRWWYAGMTCCNERERREFLPGSKWSRRTNPPLTTSARSTLVVGLFTFRDSDMVNHIRRNFRTRNSDHYRKAGFFPRVATGLRLLLVTIVNIPFTEDKRDRYFRWVHLNSLRMKF